MNSSRPIPIKKHSKSEYSEENLSFSVFVEKPQIQRLRTETIIGTTPPEHDFIQTNLNKIYPKETKKWVNSDLILQCQNCHDNFGLLVRKHHCRACGCVFCSSCCNNYVKIPKEFIQVPEEDMSYTQFFTNTKRKLLGLDSDFVCNDCYTKITNINKIISVVGSNKVGIIPIIRICEFLDLESLFRVSLISKGWYNASIHYLSKFRLIQYNNQIYNDWEINIIWLSRQYYSGHSSLIVNLIKSSLQKYYASRDKTIFQNIIEFNIFANRQDKTHLDMMCSRKCNNTLDIIDFTEILRFIIVLEKDSKSFWNDSEIKTFISFITTQVCKKSIEIIPLLVPLLCHYLVELMNCDKICIDLEYLKLIMRYITNDNNIFYFLNELNYLEDLESKSCGMINFIDYMKKFILDTIDPELIEQTIKLKQALIQIIKNEKIELPILFPLDFRYNIIKINNIKIVKSNTNPYIIDVNISPNNDYSKTSVKLTSFREESLKPKRIKFILKKAVGLRKEKIISCLIKILQYKLKEQMLLKRISRFDVIPSYFINIITKDIAVIEFVDDSLTLREISERGITLQNYILDNNNHQPIDIVKKIFVHSLAIASVISYILGLGDRHLDNIMINKSGQIFHIDYGYILENPTTNLLGAPNIKVTADMIDFLGGYTSQYYDLFTKYVIKIYDILRLYKNIIVQYYEMMGYENLINWNVVKDKVDMRFMEGMTFSDVGITLINEIETSNSFVGKFNDICHTTSHATNIFVTNFNFFKSKII